MLRRLLTGLILITNCTIAQSQPSVIYDKARLKIVAFIQDYAHGQEWTIGKIVLEGNRITKNYIIMREVPVRQGQKVAASDLLGLLESSRLNLLNTQLFLEVIPSIDSANESEIHLRFLVKERWYIFPLPYLNIVDRNPNQWLFEQNADLNRVNYGIKFTWENVSGRRDQVRFNLINGYSRQFRIYYEKPYSGKKLEHGFLIGAGYSMQRQISYATDEHKQIFFPLNTRPNNDFVRSSLNIELGYTYRRGVKYRHRVSLEYNKENISDSISRLVLQNQNKGYRSYFPGNLNQIEFSQFEYSFTYLDLNNNAYPWKGIALNAGFMQKGLGLSSINLWQLGFKVGRYIPIRQKNSLAFVGFGMVRLPYNQPVINLSGFGFGDMYLRGFEYYVVDCVSGGILKTTLRREIFNINVPTFFKNSDKYRKIPFKVVAKIYNDFGTAHLPFSNAGFLNNRLLHTYGIGVDILSYYDFVAQFDFSANQLGEKGLFLHLRQEF